MRYFKNNFLKRPKPITWKKVFRFWRENEANQPSWIKTYQEKGFDSWDNWRNTHAERLKCKELKWDFYEIINPLKNIPHFYGGSFRTWIKYYYNGKETCQFSELANLEKIKSNERINSLINNFPKETIIIGLALKNKIIIIEGMHRCCAVALISRSKKKFQGEIKIALAEYPEKNIPTIGKAN
ncbi:MAG: hypothetical protein ACT6FE_02560 [Methanosarcinaceae archaeon]